MIDELIRDLPQLSRFRSVIYGILLWSVCLYAFLRGGRDERLAAFVKIAGAYLTFAAASIFHIHYRRFALPVFCIDLAVFLSMQWIALRSQKFWPIWLTGFSGVTLVSHLAPFMPVMPSQTYYNAIALWSYPSLVMLALGTAHHHRPPKRSKG